ncbi:MAG TPA: hypothetical protein VM910_04505 [Bradyrhizobium sp.]|jgi:hypothetical protein|nr:hypothetical protein [Bradyrhizobium sp.]
MSYGGRKKEQPKQADDKSKKRPAAPSDDETEDYEDGDIATPKRDRYGTDDEPL